MSEPLSPKTVEKRWKEGSTHKKMTAYRHFFTYAYHLFTTAPLYSHWQTLLSYVRRFRAIAFFFRVLTVILAVIETGALVILTTAVFLVILPLLAALMLGILLTAAIDTGRANRLLQKELGEKKLFVFFLPRENAAFLTLWAQELSKEGHGVILVSPYWILPKGLGKGHFYFTVRKEREDLYLIRRYYFFAFRRQVLKKEAAVVVY